MQPNWITSTLQKVKTKGVFVSCFYDKMTLKTSIKLESPVKNRETSYFKILQIRNDA